MSFICDRCDRSFRWRSALARHLDRKTLCRKADYTCTDCDGTFVTLETLGKHKLLYCRRKSGNCTPLSDILMKLLDQEENVAVSQPLDEFLDSAGDNAVEPVAVVEPDVEPVEQQCIMPLMESIADPIVAEPDVNSTDQPCVIPLMEPIAEPIVTCPDVKSMEQPCVMSCFDEVVSLWISQLFALEGQIRAGSYDGAYGVINRMLEDGLITTMEHGNLLYTTRLFTRLHTIYQLGMIQECRGEYIDILVTLYDMKKLNRAAFTYLLMNV